ncbi:hypothetical protein [Ornithobacterium rhinotracheale]|uniref:Uncharacterized protein n=1 Tax=Ornithobacterium rhinotracheale (strain ATCC 51463 / DSM 15997 / CCUG 23171 / CIP 104009 / LMG 9086) TaxID=867902 RepID=I3ZZW8_ORNRL|nr:hypothetical protein [Ornithobacterium rhinotracheale]AFL97252.1 hypothetical protein Ornrh_1061 [Ornithobacterium rhinotracheale DSM 15997]AIQ00504.1 hypothetical protein Q785_05910 [Ornithobacterium rhinotracheale ORT-UMN 88]KGB66608.1 hypothetical protein Q787_06060 [Ornithobacterium rhinotracheale H06-030791]MCK0194224.1 hypothetical protein [Ornithobacterium rhinotracheale]MCK0199725.1 hypothetical protein [Ornithobacterium rhinotracheale]
MDTEKILPFLSEDSYFVTVHVADNGDRCIDFMDPSERRGRQLVESSKFDEGQLMIFEWKEGKKDPAFSMTFNVSSDKREALELLVVDKLLKKSLGLKNDSIYKGAYYILVKTPMR